MEKRSIRGQHSRMRPTENECWVAELLRRIRVEEVHVCGRRSEPPVLSYVVNFPRLEVSLSGCYENQIESSRGPVLAKVQPGAVLFAPPNCWNLPTWRGPVQVVSLLFGQKQLGVSYVTMHRPRQPALVAKKASLPRLLAGPLPKVLEAMVELQAAGGPRAALLELTRALICCVREEFLHPGANRDGTADSLLEDVCVFLQSHYQHDVSRESVAAQFGLSPNSLSRIFQDRGHMAFSGYLTHVRMDRAKHLLRSYNLKLEHVAERCGYRDAAYFCRVFRRLTRLTPGEFRSQYKPAAAFTLNTE